MRCHSAGRQQCLSPPTDPFIPPSLPVLLLFLRSILPWYRRKEKVFAPDISSSLRKSFRCLVVAPTSKAKKNKKGSIGQQWSWNRNPSSSLAFPYVDETRERFFCSLFFRRGNVGIFRKWCCGGKYGSTFFIGAAQILYQRRWGRKRRNIMRFGDFLRGDRCLFVSFGQ